MIIQMGKKSAASPKNLLNIDWELFADNNIYQQGKKELAATQALTS
jgi:hypothetical protein